MLLLDWQREFHLYSPELSLLLYAQFINNHLLQWRSYHFPKLDPRGRR